MNKLLKRKYKNYFQKIMHKVYNVIKFEVVQDLDNMFRKELIKNLVEEISFDYQRFMKKCIVLKEMSDRINENKW